MAGPWLSSVTLSWSESWPGSRLSSPSSGLTAPSLGLGARSGVRVAAVPPALTSLSAPDVRSSPPPGESALSGAGGPGFYVARGVSGPSSSSGVSSPSVSLASRCSGFQLAGASSSRVVRASRCGVLRNRLSSANEAEGSVSRSTLDLVGKCCSASSNRAPSNLSFLDLMYSSKTAGQSSRIISCGRGVG